MLKQKKIEAVIEELARLQGHELNAADRLELRSRVSGTLAAKERYRQRMTSPRVSLAQASTSPINSFPWLVLMVKAWAIPESRYRV